MFETILAPTDGSEHAGRAMNAAIDLAARYDASLIVLHVALRHASAEEVEHILNGSDIPPSIQRDIDRLHHVSAPIPVGGSGGHHELSQPLSEHIGRHIIAAAETAAQKAGVREMKSRVVSGSPTKRIVEAARSDDARLLVMGTRGLGGLNSLFHGSVSQSVRQACHCACLTIP